MHEPDRHHTRAGCFFIPIVLAGLFFWLGWLLSALQVPFENVLVGMGASIILWALFVFGLIARD